MWPVRQSVFYFESVPRHVLSLGSSDACLAALVLNHGLLDQTGVRMDVNVMEASKGSNPSCVAAPRQEKRIPITGALSPTIMRRADGPHGGHQSDHCAEEVHHHH